jgi:hypothetical protein
VQRHACGETVLHRLPSQVWGARRPGTALPPRGRVRRGGTDEDARHDGQWHDGQGHDGQAHDGQWHDAVLMATLRRAWTGGTLDDGRL